MGYVKNIIVLKDGIKIKERRAITESLASFPNGERRLVLATGKYAEEGFDDARLDTLFLTMPVSRERNPCPICRMYSSFIRRKQGGKNIRLWRQQCVSVIEYVQEKTPGLPDFKI